MKSIVSYGRRFAHSALDENAPILSLARWPAWLIACLIGQPVLTKFKTDGLRMYLIPKLHTFGSTSIYIRRDNYEPELKAISRFLGHGDVALDIGGSFGIFALFMSSYVGPTGKVYSFEPGQFSFAQLSANVRLNNRSDRVILHNVAASDQKSEIRLAHLHDSPVNFSIGEIADVQGETVHADRIDDILPEIEQNRVRFIKIDVEGYELTALTGCRVIIERNHPVIMFEVSRPALARQNLRPEDVYNFLAAFGYSFKIFQEGQFVSINDFREGNIFAISEANAMLTAVDFR